MLSTFERIKEVLLDGVRHADEINNNMSDTLKGMVVPADPVAYASHGIERLINEIVAEKCKEAFAAGKAEERAQILSQIARR